jgi:adenosylhomocysteine nucleosidase
VTELKRALILAPMTSELKPLLRYTRARRAEGDDRFSYTGRAGDVDLVIARLGVGPAPARLVTARALTVHPVDHVLVSGIAGGLDPDLSVGSVVVPDTVVDLASGQRFRAAPLARVTPVGLIGVSDRLITDDKQLAALRAQGVVALEMESSGVAAACEEAGVPWTTFRVIGDRPDEGLTDDSVISLLRPDGTADTLAAIRFMITHPGRIGGLVRLARDSSMAASKAARTTLSALGWRP